MSNDLQIPDIFKKGPMPQEFGGGTDDNLSDGIGQSYGVIGYKGKTWSLRYRGERKNLIDPGNGAPLQFLDVIIVGSAKNKSKSYYPGEFSEGDAGRPVCSSLDSITPDPDVLQKQADHCALCPKNEWKTNPKTGKKGRDCTDYKRLAVLVLPNITAPVFGQDFNEPVFLRVPPASLNSLANMGDQMKPQGWEFYSYVTRISFDPNKAHPCMIFRPIGEAPRADAPMILGLRNDPIVARIIGTNPSTDGGLVQYLQGGDVSVQDRPLPLSTPAARPVTLSPVASAGPSMAMKIIEHGGANGASPPSPPKYSMPDAGEPEESDEDLDAAIARLIAPK